MATNPRKFSTESGPIKYGSTELLFNNKKSDNPLFDLDLFKSCSNTLLQITHKLEDSVGKCDLVLLEACVMG